MNTCENMDAFEFEFLTILAIDFGLKRVGLAFSKANLPEPLLVLENDSNLIDRIVDICRRRQVEQIVVGVSEGKMAKHTKHFAIKLRRRLKDSQLSHIKLELVDETLSSHQVKEKLKQLGKNLHPLPQAGGDQVGKQSSQHNRVQKARHTSWQSRSKLHQQGQVIDHYAAALILQRWLDAQ